MKINPKILSAAAGIVIALAAAAAVRLWLYSDVEIPYDPFYHYRVAEQGWGVFAAKTFPAMTQSAWSGCFADKELGFHALVWAVAGCGKLMHLPQFPFTLPVLVSLTLLLVSFAAAANYFKADKLWFWTPLLLLIEPTFFYRSLMLRPHVLAAALLLLGCIAFASTRNWRDCWKTVLAVWLFAWSYSNPHFILFALGAFVLARFRRDKKRAVILALSGAAAFVAAAVLHPQFPNNIVLWKIQCIDVVRAMLDPAVQGVVVLGDEMRMRGVELFWLCPGAGALLILNIFFMVRQIRAGGVRSLTEEQTALAMLAAFVMVGLCFSLRMIEYVVPVNLLLLAVLASRRPLTARAAALNASLAVLLAVLFAAGVWRQRAFAEVTPPVKPLDGLARSVRLNLPPGSVIANLNWSDFSHLYYVLPEYRFLYGLDPYFGYTANPGRYSMIAALRNRPQLQLPLSLIKELVGAKVIYTSEVVPSDNLTAAGAELVYMESKFTLFWLP